MFDKDELFSIGIKFKEIKDPNKRWDDLNDKYGRPFKDGEAWRDFVRKRIKRDSNENIKKIHKDFNDKDFKKDNFTYKSTLEIKSDGTQVSDKLIEMSEEQSKDIEYLLKAHGFDSKVWELVSARNNIWNVYSKLDGVQTLYSSKIVVKPRVDNISIEDLKEHFESFNKSFIALNYRPSCYNVNGKMLELNLADLHVGKLAWVGESGENYDHKIAKKRFNYIIDDVITRTQHYKFEKILFVFSNDFFHFDTIETTTTRGTRQDSDVRWQKLFKIGIEMLVEGINKLSTIAPVETFYVGANHDKMTSYYAICYLYAWFKDNKYVTVNTEPKSRKYVEFGKNLIGFCHGEINPKRLSGLMAIEAKEAWGRTDFHEMHSAHFHSEKAIFEENGLIVRFVSSPTSTDAWHYENGFVGAIKKAQSFIWDREFGLTDILNTPII